MNHVRPTKYQVQLAIKGSRAIDVLHTMYARNDSEICAILSLPRAQK